VLNVLAPELVLQLRIIDSERPRKMRAGVTQTDTIGMAISLMAKVIRHEPRDSGSPHLRDFNPAYVSLGSSIAGEVPCVEDQGVIHLTQGRIGPQFSGSGHELITDWPRALTALPIYC
jgi:hypothetical protein